MESEGQSNPVQFGKSGLLVGFSGFSFSQTASPSATLLLVDLMWLSKTTVRVRISPARKYNTRRVVINSADPLLDSTLEPNPSVAKHFQEPWGIIYRQTSWTVYTVMID